MTGAGVSAESGVPTFRGSGGLWRKYKSEEVAAINTLYRDPSIVWEFYHYRREVMLTKKPNAVSFFIMIYYNIRIFVRDATIIITCVEE